MNARRWVLGAVLGAIGALLAGCRSEQSARGPGERGAPPEYAEAAAAYNKRVLPLERLYTTTTMTVWYPNEEGEQDRAQVEGHLNYIRPSKVSLTMEKVGQFVSGLGCNEKQYWWIEKNEAEKAHVGDMAAVNRERVAKLGLPVHPLDLVELLGITPLPDSGENTSAQWSKDGKSLVFTVPGRQGPRRVWVDPKTYEPSRIELLDSGGNVVVSAELERYEPVLMPGTPKPPRVALRMVASTMTDRVGRDGKPLELRVRLNLGEPEVTKERPKPAVFDFDTLVRVYKIRQIKRLD